MNYPDRPPHQIDRPVITQVWEDVTMLHWRVTAADVARLLPQGVEPDCADGSAWISLVPFRMSRLTVPPLLPPPYISRFCETNIRTYVVGPDGPGVYFFSLEIPVVAGVPVARIGFGQPYTWSQMRMARRGQEIRYLSRRRWPRSSHGTHPLPTSRVGVTIGDRIKPDPLDRFLLNRWGAYSMIRGRLHHARVVHAPWPVHKAKVTVLQDQLGEAAGFPIGPIVRSHYALRADQVGFSLPTRSG